MRFNDDKVGQLLRHDKRDLLRQHKPNDPLAVPIKKQKKTFRGQGSVNWMREQFPLTLCYAITAHKVVIIYVSISCFTELKILESGTNTRRSNP